MPEQPYTPARWLVAPGNEAAFEAARRDPAAFFLALKQPPRWGTPLRGAEEPRLYYSFGPWPSTETIAAMRSDPGTPAAIGRLAALCEEAELGTFLAAAGLRVEAQFGDWDQDRVHLPPRAPRSSPSLSGHKGVRSREAKRKPPRQRVLKQVPGTCFVHGKSVSATRWDSGCQLGASALARPAPAMPQTATT